MPTLECPDCHAQYYTAATGQVLDLVLLMFECAACDAKEPLCRADDGVGYLAEPESRAAAG